MATKKRKGIRAPKPVETPQLSVDEERKKKAHDIASRWLKLIDGRRSKEKSWRDAADTVVDRYRDERDAQSRNETRFNIFSANVETLKPAIFSRMPVPDVRRSNSDQDPIGRTAAEILERGLKYCVRQPQFRDACERVREDYLLPGRGIARVKYAPLIEQRQQRIPVDPLPDDGEDDSEELAASETLRGTLERNMAGESAAREPRYPEGTQFDGQGAYRNEMQEELIYQEVYPCYHPWDLFVFWPARAASWDKVTGVAFGTEMTKREIKAHAKYARFADELNYEYKTEEAKDGDEEERTTIVWDVYDKTSRKLIVVASGFTDSPLDLQDDPLELEQFFPNPEPIYSIRTNGNWIPRPEYLLYQDQAIELDEVTERLRMLTGALKNRGVYDQSLGPDAKLETLATAGDNEFRPIPNFRSLVEKGGLKAIFDALPLDQIIKVIADLKERQYELKEIIYEVTGISDIVRGATKASETLGAQKLKAQYGNLRISTRQDRFQQFMRDLLAIQAEIMVEHFEPMTLKLMSNMTVLPDIAYAQMKQAKELPAGAVSETMFMQACALLRSDKLRGFRIDIETDSTVPIDKEMEQEQRTQFVQGLAQFLSQALPAVQQGVLPPGVARETLLFLVRGFKAGSQLEEVLEQLGSSGEAQEQVQLTQQLQGQIQQMQEQLQEAGDENQKLKDENAKLGNKDQAATIKAQRDADLKANSAALDAQIKQQAADQDAANKERDAQQDMRLKELEAAQDRRNAELDAKLDRVIAMQEAASQPPEEPAEPEGEDINTSAIKSMMDGMQKSQEAILQLVQTLVASQAKKGPVTKRGTAKMSDGKVIELHVTEDAGEAA